ncbi:MAG: methyltransferase, partial [Fimbriimonadaceae bacterium]
MTPERDPHEVRDYLIATAQVAVLVLLAREALLGWPWREATWWMFAVAGAVAVPSFVTLGKSLTIRPTPNRRGLRTGGVYRVVRHPMYLSLLIVGAAVGVSGGERAWTVFFGLVLVVGLKIAIEERHLAEVYPEFEAYAQIG